MTDDFGTVPLLPEVDALQAEIRGHQDFVAGWNAQGGAIVTDAEADGGAAFCPRADAVDDRLFG